MRRDRTRVLSLLLVTLLTPGRVAYANPTWATTGSLTTARLAHRATLLPNGQVLVTGGVGATDSSGFPTTVASAEVYDPGTGTWSSAGSMLTARDNGHSATLLPNGQVLVAGGAYSSNGSSTLVASAELYDPLTRTWSSTGSMNEARWSHTATLLPDGRVLVAGGSNRSSGSTTILASAELYDPTTGTWSGTGSMAETRIWSSATLLPNGRVLVAGGADGSLNSLASAELYDPSTGLWSSTGSMDEPHSAAPATVLPTGQVLVVGGIGGADSSGFVIHVASAELYDPTSGTWSSTGSMLTARGSHSSNLLPNGHLLVAGGLSVNSGSFTYLASAELYDPMAGTWSTTTPFNVARSDHTATLLPNGQLLVATGLSAGTLTASAELFSLDTTAPVLSLPDTMTVNATSPLGAVVNYTASASDPDDPPEQLTVTCSPAPGTTFAIGTTTVSCAASDPFGNTSTGSFQVIVNGAAGQLTDLFSVVNSLELASGLTNSLISKLHDALSGFDAGKTARACGKLKDFISEVNAQTGKGITPAQASELITSAERIRAVMGCS